MYQHPTPSMSISGIQGQLLEVTVVGCNKLKDTEWISRQDPYVCLEYGSSNFRTKTCTDGGKNPTFQEKFVFTLIEGLPELKIVVWNSNTLNYDDFIGSGKIHLQKVLSQGYDDTPWPLQTTSGRNAGEVRLILHYPNANKPATSFAPSAPPCAAPQVPPYALATPYPAPYSYPLSSVAYPPYPFPTPQTAAYPPQPYPPTPFPQPYPPPPQALPYYAYPPGTYPGIYPPPPY